MAASCLSGRYLWKSGVQTGFVHGKNGSLILKFQEKQGIFISRTYDRGSAETEWGKLKLDIGSNTAFHVYILFFKNIETGKRIDTMQDIGAQYDYIVSHAQLRSDYREVLLYKKGLRTGRYIKICIEVIRGKEEDKISLRGYEITFPKENFTAYLPAIYQDNPDLEKYMAVLQELYLDLEQKIEEIPKELDFEYCEPEQRVRLAGWLGYEPGVNKLDTQILEKLLKEGLQLAKQKGTKAYYEKLAELLLDKKAVLAEDNKNKECTLLIQGQRDKEQEPYIKWLTANAPIGVTMKAVFLEPTDRLDGTCYLDYTAVISQKTCELMTEGINIDNIVLL